MLLFNKFQFEKKIYYPSCWKSSRKSLSDSKFDNNHNNHNNHIYYLMNYNLKKKHWNMLPIIDCNMTVQLLKKWHDSKFDNNHNDHNYITIESIATRERNLLS